MLSVSERPMDADSCYACDQPAISREHVPPRCIFPEDRDLPDGVSMRRGSLIRVPSCAAHNAEKSDDDEYFRFVLASNVMANDAGHGQALTKVLRSFLRRPAVKERFLQGAKPVRIRESHGTNVHEAEEMPLEFERFNNSLRLVALGVYRYHYGSRFNGNVASVADFIDYNPDNTELQTIRVALFDEAARVFASQPKAGDNPEVFWYQVRELNKSHTIMRLGFYGLSTATVLFGDLPR